MRRCVFLDRDAVINVKPKPGEHIRTWEEFRPIPSVLDWIRLFHALDLLVIVVTNQQGVARGVIEPAELERIHENMRAELRALVHASTTLSAVSTKRAHATAASGDRECCWRRPRNGASTLVSR